MSVVFPQRPQPSSGVLTPNISSAPSGYNNNNKIPIENRNTRDTAPGKEIEIIVLRPSIRPPSYEEVASATNNNNNNSSSPNRYPSVSRNNNLPSPVPSMELGATHNNNHTFSRTNNTNSTAADFSPISHPNHVCTCAVPEPYGNQADLVDTPGATKNNNNNGSSAKQQQRHATFLLNQEGELSKQQESQKGGGISPAASPQRRPSSPRKLACWNVGKRGEDSIPTLKYRTIGDTVKGCLATNDHRPLTGKELHVDWKRICALQSGKEIFKLRPPYIDRDEFADPIKLTAETRTSGKPMVMIPSGYTMSARRDGKTWDYVAQSFRPTAKENVQVALKPTQVNPLDEKFTLQGYHSGTNGTNQELEDHKYPTTNYGSEIQQQNNNNNSRSNTHTNNGQLLVIPNSGDKLTNSRSLREASAIALNIPPSNPIIEDADRRLQQRGFGSLTQVARASDEAVSHLLKVCGFPDAQRLVILWEIRKAKNGRK